MAPAKTPDLFELKNRAQLHYFEFAPLLLREIEFEDRHLSDLALRGVHLDFSEKLGTAMGICYPEERKIVFNLRYFKKRVDLLPYTIFHEMVHQFLFDLKKPWGHNKRFYFLMELFPSWYPIDENVYIHSRSAGAGKKLMEDRETERTVEDKLNELMRTRYGTIL